MREWLGRLVGVLLSPIVFLLALARGARAFHPDGVIYRADVTSDAPEGSPLAHAAARLSGPALVRLSAALRPRGDERPDVLGLGIRFGAAGEQDLLLGSFQSFAPAALSAARAQTDTRDFLDNDYHAVARYRIAGVGEIRLTARGLAGAPPGATREDRLAQAAAAGRAVLRLSVSVLPAEEPQPLVLLKLVERSSVPSPALRLNPARAGRGLQPFGFLTGLRWAVYPASQLGRRLADRRALAVPAVIKSSGDEC